MQNASPPAYHFGAGESTGVPGSRWELAGPTRQCWLGTSFMAVGRRAPGERKLNDGAGSFTRFALQPNASLVRLDDGAHDRETQPGAPGRAGTRRIGSNEAVHDVRQELGRDADASIGNHELGYPILLSEI